jgi:hypothetical protein
LWIFSHNSWLTFVGFKRHPGFVVDYDHFSRHTKHQCLPVIGEGGCFGFPSSILSDDDPAPWWVDIILSM